MIYKWLSIKHPHQIWKRRSACCRNRCKKPADSFCVFGQLKDALAKTKRLQEQKKDLDGQLAAAKDALQVANVAFENAQSEVFEYRAYYDKLVRVEKERDELKRQRDDARQARDEARQERDEFTQELTELREARTRYAETLSEHKKRYGTLMDAYDRQMARSGQDRVKIQTQRAEIAEFKRQLTGRSKGVVDIVTLLKSPVQENDSNARNAETPKDKAAKRKHGEVFAENEGKSLAMFQHTSHRD